MKKIKLVGMIFILLVVSFCVCFLLMDIERVKAGSSPGQEKYTPTKLEWAAVWLNSYYRVRTKISDGSVFKREIRIRFEIKYPDTVVVYVRYGKKIDRRVLNATVEYFKKLVKGYANKKGFSWMRIEEKTEMLR